MTSSYLTATRTSYGTCDSFTPDPESGDDTAYADVTEAVKYLAGAGLMA